MAENANVKNIKKVNKDVKQVKKSSVLVKKQVSSNAKSVKKALSHNKKQDEEIEKLKADLQKLKSTDKKKVNSKRISEYNLFIRRQINSGMSFEKAVAQWNKYKSLEDKTGRRPSAYNQFIGSQMRLGKTMEESIVLWKLAKEGKLGKKGSTRTITKTVIKKVPTVKKVLTPPKIQTRTVTKVVEKEPSFDYSKIKNIVQSSVDDIQSSMRSSISSMDISVKSHLKSVNLIDDENVAINLVQTYFKEIARLGFKRQLTLDEIINHYFYALVKVRLVSESKTSMMTDEEVSLRLVQLYCAEIPRLGFKRKLDLDQIVEIYFYVLNKLKNKEELIKKIKTASNISQSNSQDSSKQDSNEKQSNQNIDLTVTAKVTAPKEMDSQSNQNAPIIKKEKTIAEILEESSDIE
ncbi:MAG: hypothetical protein PHQ98_00695 [Candidatus ainarchaeum sp.]|nr:hypothetical protein [Candidatus ainarchaeum sp.]